MELFKRIRQKTGDAIIKNKMAQAKRKKHFANINQIKNVGIVWDASKIEDFASLTRFHQKMNQSKTDVKILGYFPGKNLPDQYTAIRYLTIFKKEELNFFYHPVSDETKAFMNNVFDLLIDINFKKLVPLRYVSSLSKANFKVGLFESENENTPFDLMMEIKSPVNVEDYLNQVIYYLGMINSGTVKS